MNALINYALAHSRTMLSILALLLVAGWNTFQNIPKEANPDIPIPFMYVSITHDGISPEDAERLLVRPMEQELRSIEGVKEMVSTASEGHASVQLEFQAGMDSAAALADVRDAVTLAKAKLPSETEEPTVNEITMADQSPVLTLMLSGSLPERTLSLLARNLRDKLEGIGEVLEVKIRGSREEMLEVVVNPSLMESYDITIAEIFSLVTNNNRLVAAGTLDTGAGRFAVKVPGIIKDINDVLNMPLKVNFDKVVLFKDVAVLRKTFKDPTSFARLNGQAAIALDVIKRPGENAISTVAKLKSLIKKESKLWPLGLKVDFTGDESKQIRIMLGDLTNNVLSAVLLVTIIIVAFLGLRTAGLVGIAIPGSFLSGILVLSLIGITINIVVLFALIMSVGMLVDGAIVVTEFADRKMSEGVSKQQAYGMAARRMAWPIIASTLTTLAAFMPLLFWPGIMGEFMKYLPMTLIAVLAASLLMALIFVPTLGAAFGAPRYVSATAVRNFQAAESGDLTQVDGFTGKYMTILQWAIARPWWILLTACCLLYAAFELNSSWGKGSEFFPEVEPEGVSVLIKARGDLSIHEKDKIVAEVENKILHIGGVETFYTRVQGNDTIGRIRLNFLEWDQRLPAAQIIAQIRQNTENVAGVEVQIRKDNNSPGGGKPLVIHLKSRFPDLVNDAVEKLRTVIHQVGGFTDIEDSRPLPGIEWRLTVDREKAARFGANVTTVGNMVQLITTGIKLTEYRPDDADDEVDIRIRYAADVRNLDQLDTLRVRTDYGLVPISNFVERGPAQKIDSIRRIDGKRTLTLTAELAPGVQLSQRLPLLMAAVAQAGIDPQVTLELKGDDEEQKKSQAFLAKAFVTALMVMAIILVTQFNSFYQALLILSAVIFSTAGVFMGHIIMQQPFSTVMSGIGVIALAGIVVNNNIVLIDAYNHLRKAGLPALEAAVRTGAQRLRPVLLTTVTTILGLLPMVMQMNIDLVTREISFGAPSTQWWVQLASAVAFGLAFATVLTLILTPCLLVIGDRVNRVWQKPGAKQQKVGSVSAV